MGIESYSIVTDGPIPLIYVPAPGFPSVEMDAFHSIKSDVRP